MEVKVEIKEEPLWTENTLHSEVLAVSYHQLQNEDKDTYDGKDGDIPAVQLPRKCKEEHSYDALWVPGPSTDEYMEEINYVAVKEENTDCEEIITSDPLTSFPAESNSDQEIKTFIQNGKTMYKCTNCDRAFPWMAWLKKHSIIHKAKKPYKCEICDKTFPYKQSLTGHYLSHERRPHVCKICGKSFLRSSSLKNHISVHEGKHPFKCDICGKTFAKKHRLKEHTFVHEGHKPHKCDVCDKTFTYKHSLKEHYLIHEGKMQYTCVICNKSFTHKSYLRKHTLSHHGSKP